MRTNIDKIEELLELGIGMGPGKRFLLVYEGELAITNRVGLANWPPGRREIVARLDATDCLHGPNWRKWDEIFEKLHAIESRNTNDTETFGSVQGEEGLFELETEQISKPMR